MLFESFNPQGR